MRLRRIVIESKVMMWGDLASSVGFGGCFFRWIVADFCALPDFVLLGLMKGPCGDLV